MHVNYIAEIKAFYDRIELNPLPSPAIALWHALMSIANKTGWQQEFTVPVSVLVLKSGLNAQAIKRARNRLEQDGYITWRSRGENQSAAYRLNSLVVQNSAGNVPQDVPQTEPQSVPQCQNVPQNVLQNVPQTKPQSEPLSEPQSVPINKQKQNETKTKTDRPPISPVRRLDDFWAVYPKQKNRYLAETEYCNAVLAGVPEDDLVEAATRYAEHCRKGRIREQFIKNPENFLRDNVFLDYLKGGEDGRADKYVDADKKSLNEIMQERGNRGEFSGF